MEKEKIRKLISEKIGSIYRLSKVSGVSMPVLYKALSGISNASPSSAVKLMKAGLDWSLVREFVSEDVRELGDLIEKKAIEKAKGGKK